MSVEIQKIVNQSIQSADDVLQNKSHSQAKMQWRSAFERVKRIGKGSLNEGALMIHEDYWLEVVGIPEKIYCLNGSDTLLHLRPKYHYEEQFRQWKLNDKEQLSFFEYLTRNVAKNLKPEDLKTVDYKDEDSAKKCIVSFCDGKPMHGDTILEDGKYKFALSTNGKTLYAAKKEKKVKGELRHSSFTVGSCVRSAGKLIVKGGEIVEIAPCHSGHYKPSMLNGEYILDYLRKSFRLGDDAVKKIKVIQFNYISPVKTILHAILSKEVVMRIYKLVKKNFGIKIFQK